MKLTLAVVVSVALTVGRAAEAQTAVAPLTLTVDEAVRRGVAAAPRLAEARAREAAATATVMSRAAQGRPTVSGLAGFLRTNHVQEFGIQQPNGTSLIIFPDLTNNVRARAELVLPLYTAGRVDALVASAEADGRAAGADRQAVEADVSLDTARAYWLLVWARATTGVLEQALGRADASVGDVRARVDAGLLPPNDLLSAQAQRAREQVRLIQAQNEAALAEADLGRLVGAAPGQAIVPASAVDQPAPAVAALGPLDPRTPQTIDALVARARDARGERRAFVERQAAWRAGASAALAAQKPQVSALAAIEPSRPNPRWVPRRDALHTSWDLGVTVTWQLHDGGRARAENAVAVAHADAAAARLADFDAAVAVEVRQRVLEISSHRAALDASAEGIAAAAEARRVVGERFAAGVATSTEILDAQVALLDAELERTRIQAALRLAEARLVRAVGGP